MSEATKIILAVVISTGLISLWLAVAVLSL